MYYHYPAIEAYINDVWMNSTNDDYGEEKVVSTNATKRYEYTIATL